MRRHVNAERLRRHLLFSLRFVLTLRSAKCLLGSIGYVSCWREVIKSCLGMPYDITIEYI